MCPRPGHADEQQAPLFGRIRARPGRRSPAAGRALTAGRDLIAAPAVLAGEVLAWMIARMRAPAGDVERAAVEYGALLVAVELLRERTAIEVENRLRGGLLDELFSGAAVPDLVLKRALAFGYDLTTPSRVFLVEAASEETAAAGGPATPVDPKSFYPPVADCARRWSTTNFVAVRGGAVVVVVPETPDPGRQRPDEPRFEDDLRSVVIS